MPFTPFHMGPGLLLKALLQGSFSLLVFGWTQIVMDIQPLIVLITGAGHLHGFSHTYIGASLIAVGTAVSGKYASQWLLALGNRRRLPPIGWAVCLLSAFLGAFSHVMLDSIMHADLQPFVPWAENNPFLDSVSIAMLHKFCLYSGLLGLGLYFPLAFWVGRRKTPH